MSTLYRFPAENARHCGVEIVCYNSDGSLELHPYVNGETLPEITLTRNKDGRYIIKATGWGGNFSTLENATRPVIRNIAASLNIRPSQLWAAAEWIERTPPERPLSREEDLIANAL